MAAQKRHKFAFDVLAIDGTWQRMYFPTAGVVKAAALGFLANGYSVRMALVNDIPVERTTLS